MAATSRGRKQIAFFVLLTLQVGGEARAAADDEDRDGDDRDAIDDPHFARNSESMPQREPSPPAATIVDTSTAPIVGTVRTGVYLDSDQTIVFRALAAISGTVGKWTINTSAAFDVVSSASVDVRSSPGLSKVDVVTTASGTSTTGGKMFDRRLAGTLGAGWQSGNGHAVAFSASYANEHDYNSVSGGLNGSVDVFHRMTTLLGGVSFTRNWIGSVLDSTFAKTSYEVRWSAGFAQVLSQRDALRLRYDGALGAGYMASPYRNVRFGTWTTTVGENQQLVFHNTTGAAEGLPEREPSRRIRSALTLEYLHSFHTNLALALQVRLGTDTWDVRSASAGVELRGAWRAWRLQVGYRFYAQSSARFFATKYTEAASSYSYYTSDKELAQEIGHTPHIDIARVVKQASRPGSGRVVLDLRLTGFFYRYPNFALLSSRAGGFLDFGVTFE